MTRARSPTRSSSSKRATGRSRSSPPGSGTSATAAATRRLRTALLEPGRRAGLVPRLHAPPLRELGRRPQRRLAHLPPAVLRRGHPAVVPARRRRRARLPQPHRPRRGVAAHRPLHRHAPRLQPPTNGASPAGSLRDPDVMDTWATSSLTPQIAGLWEEDADLWGRVYPMDLRPQAHDIIRTWLFSTVVRAHFESDSLPWRSTALSGWILDPDRKKMSKSKGNVVTPMALFDQYGVRRGPLLGGLRPARRGHRLRRGPDEDRPQAGHQAAQRLQIRPRDRRRGPRRPASPSRSTSPCWPTSPRSSPRPPPRSRPTTTPGRWNGPRRSSGGSATTTSSWPRVAPTAS